MDVGVALWTMQSTAARPTSKTLLYERLRTDAGLIAELGFGSLWLAEHRFWYDGWCPSPMVAAASICAHVPHLRIGTAIAILPQHSPRRFADTVRAFDQISGNRLELGVGLGHRDTEYDGLGLRRASRGRMMDEALDVVCADDIGGELSRRIWVGGIAKPALQRAARRGLNVILPQTLRGDEVDDTIGRLRHYSADEGKPTAKIAMQQDIWVDVDGSRAREYFLPRLISHYREEAGAWWIMKNQSHGFDVPTALDAQVQRIVETASVGTPDLVTEKLIGLEAAGVDQLIIRVNFDNTEERWPDTLKLIASEVLPALRSPAQ
jgi:alkanesulfonate monooxygenase SsuD/methylene tetrahydromethanopterin reductase-like flavin-dependent oxidoreductase (luciferase family)